MHKCDGLNIKCDGSRSAFHGVHLTQFNMTVNVPGIREFCDLYLHLSSGGTDDWGRGGGGTYYTGTWYFTTTVQQRPRKLLKMSVISKEFNLSGVRITGKTLGRGSYGEVIEVEWCGTLCAAKRMHEIFLKEMPKSDVEKMISDFKRECQTWFSLRHPNIVQLLGNFYQKNSDVPLFLLEKMDISLRHYLENHKKEDFHLLNKVFVLRQVAQGLCYLHHHNPPLVHHDLSPNNILMNKVSFLTKLTDFGMTRTICQSKLTRQSSVKGTQAFMPPEALRIPPRYTEKLDVFSYGNCITTTLIHEWPNPTHPTKEDGDRLVALTEYERREHQINSISTHEKQFFLSLIKGCLANRADSRPSSAELLTEIKRIESTIQSVQPAEVNQLQQAISQLNLEAKQRVQLEQKLEKHLREEHERQEAELSQLRGDVASQNVIIAQLNRDVNELKSENLAIVSEKELIVSRNVQISKDITQLRSTQSSKVRILSIEFMSSVPLNFVYIYVYTIKGTLN